MIRVRITTVGATPMLCAFDFVAVAERADVNEDLLATDSAAHVSILILNKY